MQQQVQAVPGAEPGQFLHMHEAVLENLFPDGASPAGPRHQGHELRLQISWKTRIRLSSNLGSLNRAMTVDHHVVTFKGEIDPKN